MLYGLFHELAKAKHYNQYPNTSPNALPCSSLIIFIFTLKRLPLDPYRTKSALSLATTSLFSSSSRSN